MNLILYRVALVAAFHVCALAEPVATFHMRVFVSRLCTKPRSQNFPTAKLGRLRFKWQGIDVNSSGQLSGNSEDLLRERLRLSPDLAHVAIGVKRAFRGTGVANNVGLALVRLDVHRTETTKVI